MTSLTAAEIQQYQDTGYLFPIRVLTEAEAADYRSKLEAIEAGRRRQQ